MMGAVGASAIFGLAAVPATGSARAFPAHPFVPGSVVVASSQYPAQGDPAIQFGQPLPSGTPAVSDGKYPEVFNNDGPDGSFAVATPIELSDLTSSGDQLNQTAVPTDQVTTSFSSKSELAINFSTNGQDLSFLGYNAAPDALDSSNSDTPLARDSTNPDQQGPYNRVAANLDSSGQWTFTDSNAYSGDNGRAVLLNNDLGLFYAAGNSNNGDSTTENSITDSGGAQGFAQSFQSQADQGQGAAIGRLATFTYKTRDKYGKDTNFRGLTISGGVVYLTKGSGSNGTNSVYFIDTTGTACSATDGVGLPIPGAPLPTLTTPPYRMCVLKGFNNLSAKGSSAPNIFPFGIWFANPTTLYVADEGDGNLTTAANPTPYDDAANQAKAGLQKWTLNTTDPNNEFWQYDYTVQTGLNLGQPYTVPGYPTGTNPGTGEPWGVATDGLRNISGQVNSANGTATIYAATSTVSGSGDQGADPNEVVKITDPINATAPASGEAFTTVAGPKTRTLYRGVAVVPASYGQ
jgi:hypothetical protein